MGLGPRFNASPPQGSRAEDSSSEGGAPHPRVSRWRALFHRRKKTGVLSRQPVSPSVVLACANCGFDYTVTRMEVGGKTTLLWTCECRSQFIPPGGPESFELVRP